MAEVAQALEMKLIYPAFRLAGETREFTIVLFQHDAFSLHFLRRSEAWLARIAVQEEIAQDGVVTSVGRQADCTLWRFLRPRLTFSRMSEAAAVQTKGLGSAL